MTQKTVITKNRITSKILFRLTQNFSYIRSSLCSRHLQSFKSVLKKLFVSLALKRCAPNELSGAAGTFGSGGRSSRWPSRIPLLDRSYCCCDCCCCGPHGARIHTRCGDVTVPVLLLTSFWRSFLSTYRIRNIICIVLYYQSIAQGPVALPNITNGQNFLLWLLRS